MPYVFRRPWRRLARQQRKLFPTPQPPLNAEAGSFALNGSAITFPFTEAPGNFALGGVSAPFTARMTAVGEAYALAGVAAGFTRDFVNWLPRPFVAAVWSASPAPPGGSWAPAAAASGNWTVDPAMAIPPKVTS